MEYPSKLGLHAVPKYNYAENFSNKREEAFFVYAYYHDKKQYPLLMHCHDYYELNIITQGEGRHYIEDNYTPARCGSVFVLPPNIMHGYYAGPDLEIFHLVLSNSFINKFSKELSSLAGYSTLFEIEPILRKALTDELFLQLSVSEMKMLLPELNNLVACEKIDYKGIKTIKNARALSIIGTLTQLISQKKPSGSEQNQPPAKNLIKSVEYIHENYMEKIHVQELADICFMSYATFSRYFKRVFNVSPTEYIMVLRIKNAKKLLRDTEKPVSLIAQECGFFDLSHFSHYFFAYEKMTPIQYRKYNE